MTKNTIIITLLSFVVFVACGDKGKTTMPKNTVAIVGNVYLTKGQILREMPTGLSSEDSLAFTEQYIDKWVKEQVVVQKAEEVLPEESRNVSERLEKYRKSLLRYTYEQAFLVNRLDTVVEPWEIKEYYDKHKEDFLLKEFIIKGYYAVFKDSVDVENVKQWYKLKTKEDYISLLGFSEMYAEEYHLDTLNWGYFDEVRDKIPMEDIRETSFVKHKKETYFSESGYHYFLNVLDSKLDDELSPLEFEQEKIKAIIINKRAQKIRAELTANLYQDAQKKGIIKILR